MYHFLNVIELFWPGFFLLLTLGGNWQPWPPTATSAGPSSPPTGEAAEPSPLPTCFRTADVYLWMNVKHLWKWNGSIFHILQENTHFWPRYRACDFLGHHGLSLIKRDLGCWFLWQKLTAVHFFFLSSLLKSNQPFDNHRLLIFSTGIDDNFSQRSWELTSLLRTPSWCRTQLIFSKRQIWTFCSRYKDTKFVYLCNCSCSWNGVKEPCVSTEN